MNWLLLGGAVLMAWLITNLLRDRKRAFNRLAASEAMLRAVLDHAPIGIWMQNRAGRLLFVNQAFCDAVGIPEQRFLAMPHYAELYPPEVAASCMASDRAALAGSGPHVSREQLRFTDGKMHDVEILKVRLMDERGGIAGLIGLSLDITARQQAEAERKSLEEQLRQSQKMEAIGQLAGGVAHDFNNLLTAILGSVDLLQLGGLTAAEQADLLGQITAAGRRAAGLTSQLLTFSRRQELTLVETDLNRVVAHVGKMLHRLLGEDIEFHITPADAPLPILADPGAIEQVLMNLAVNARDAIPSGGRLDISTAAVEITAEAARAAPPATAGPKIRLTVSDNGCGIPPENLAKIFEPFFTTKEAGKGTGLGLSIIYAIMRQHSGWIEVRSRVGEGTAFDLYFPRCQTTQSAAASPEKPATALPLGAGECVLLVEDDPMVSQLARIALQRAHYRVLAVESGPAAVALWAQHRAKVALLLTDMVMPGGMTGRELAQILWRDAPDLPVIFSSGYNAKQGKQEEVSSERRSAFIQKPYELAELLTVVRQMLTRR